MYDRKSVKSEIVRTLNRLERRFESVKIKYIRADNAKEFRALEKELEEKGIQLEYSSNYTPEQNGAAERLNRTLITMVRCMLQHAELPDGFWAEAVIYANHLRNILPLSEGKSPFERWHGVKPLIESERTFGMLCKVHIPKRDSKLHPVAMDGIYLGYLSPTQCRVYIPAHKRGEYHTNVKVFEGMKATHLLSEIPTNSQISPPAMMLVDLNARHHPDEEVVSGDNIHHAEPRVDPQALDDININQQVGHFMPPVYRRENITEIVHANSGDTRLIRSTPSSDISPQREDSVPDLQNQQDLTKNPILENPSQDPPREGVDISDQVHELFSIPHQTASTETVHENQDSDKNPKVDIDKPPSPDVVNTNDGMEVDNDDVDMMDAHEAQEAPARPQRERKSTYNRYSFDNVFGALALVEGYKQFGGTALLANANPDVLTY